MCACRGRADNVRAAYMTCLSPSETKQAPGGDILSPCSGLRAIFVRRLKPLWMTAAAIWLTFTGFRAGLLLARINGLRGVDMAEGARCFLLGMRYDAVPMGYLMLPLVLILCLARAESFTGKWLRRTVTIYATAAIVLVVAVEIIGACFFLHYGLRLNWMVLYYLQYPKEVATFLLENYPVWLFVTFVVAAVYGCHRLLRWLFWRKTGPANCALPSRIVSAAALAGLCILACRGGADHRPLQRSSAYISYNNLVNQLTLNNFFTFSGAVRMQLTGNRNEDKWYPFPPASDATKVAAEMLFRPSLDEVRPNARSALWRRSHTGRQRVDYNVVMIVMESMAGRQVGAQGHWPTCTPQLDELCRKGTFFDRMYAVGGRTCRGMMALLCGHPDIGGETILKRPRAMGEFLTLPKVLKDRGYETLFIYGGDPNFDNMGSFFRAHGMERIVGQDEIGKDKAGNWGVPDEMIFDTAHKTFEQMGDKKFFAVVLTVSNHEPFVVPTDKTPLEPASSPAGKRRNALRYADWALGNFFRTARESRYFKRTIFVLVADTGRALDQRLILDVPGHRIPCLIYAPGIRPAIAPPRRIDTVCSQTDVPPTVLSLLGGSYDHCFLGRDLLSIRPGDGFAFLHEDDRLGFVRGNHALLLPPLCDPILFRISAAEMVRVRMARTDPQEVHNLKLQMLSYYEMARQLFLKSAYGPPADARTGRRQPVRAQ